jgi:protein-disulfide isomerase
LRRILLMSVTMIAFAFGPAQAGPLSPVGPQDMVLGPADAPVTVIEYASLTCPHCSRWETEVFPQVRKEWIDTGKIRFVFRDFPLDGLALKAAQLAHCTGDDRFWGFLQAEFGNQAAWAQDADPIGALAKLARLGGVPEATARSCMADDSPLAKSVAASRTSGDNAGVEGTPTFYFNGKPIGREVPYDEFVSELHAAGVKP